MGRVEQWHQSLVSYGMTPWFITMLWFFNRVGDRNMLLDWEYIQALFRAISPFYWASMGIYMAIGASITGAAWCAVAVGRLAGQPTYQRAMLWNIVEPPERRAGGMHRHCELCLRACSDCAGLGTRFLDLCMWVPPCPSLSAARSAYAGASSAPAAVCSARHCERRTSPPRI